jgi:gliding motility-associated-like protein
VLNPAWQINWQDGTSGPTYSILQPGIYKLSATNNCGTTTDDLVVSTGLCKVFVPNGFTPNNDGKNDLFKAFGTESVTEYDMKVFDRGGMVIFQSRDKSKGWDGKLNGVPFSSGVFVYMLHYKEGNTAEQVLLKGTITLIR